MQTKKGIATILLVVFLFIPLATAVTPTSQPWGINTKDWTIADPNATLPPIPTETPTPQTNTSITPNPSSNTTTPTETPTATPIGQTPQPTTTTENPTPTPTTILQIYNNSLPIIPIVVAIVLLGISIPGIFILLRKRSGGIEQ